MPINDYKCPLCGAVTESLDDLSGKPCANPCEGVLRRLYSLYIRPVDGGGGSPGRRVGQ